jgi:hypothetical protein
MAGYARRFAHWVERTVIMTSSRLALITVVLLSSAGLHGAYATEVPIEAFCGEYTGHSISSTEGDLSERDLSVSVSDCGEGFTLAWTTVTKKAGGRIKRKSYSIDFRPSGRPSIYASAMRNNLFGKKIPLDPLNGDPYMWARLSGRILTIFALLITDNGGYEMQIYDRALTEAGMDLRFSRSRDGRQLKLITGTLVRSGR